ncbi:MAG TPA: DUF1648 domain-containing protein [Candidatus Acidoferrales bacterium]|nr:DUF1648 domain-containing protein [Candidatus Acidoferrales bacterium]
MSITWKMVGIVPSILAVAFFVSLSRAWDDLPDQIATHFDFCGDPNSWMSKRSFALIAGVFGVGFSVFIAWLAFSSPFHVPRFVPGVLTLAAFIFFLAFWQIVNFNAYDKPFRSAWILSLAAIMLVLIFIGIFLQPGALGN